MEVDWTVTVQERISEHHEITREQGKISTHVQVLEIVVTLVEAELMIDVASQVVAIVIGTAAMIEIKVIGVEVTVIEVGTIDATTREVSVGEDSVEMLLEAAQVTAETTE